MPEQLTEDRIAVLLQSVALAQYVGISLVFLDFYQIPFGQPEKWIEPEERLEHAQEQFLCSVTVGDMTCLVCDDHRPVFRSDIGTDIERLAKRKGRVDGGVLRQRVAFSPNKFRSPAQSADFQDAIDDQCQQD